VSPLTGLPGALSTEIEMESRFSSGGPFYASYIDINNFKPFNDAYGFEKGDLVIEALSGLVKDSLSRFDAGESFCGHVGGDDFVVLTSRDPEFAMKWLAFEFDRQIRGFYTETDLSRGGIVSFDREGRRKRFPLMSISIVSLCCGKAVRSKGEISYQLARFKRKAKHEAMCTEGSVFLPSKGDEEATDAEWVLPNLIQGHSVPASCRRAAMEAAGELRVKETVDCLRFVLKKSPDDKLRKSAAYSLGRMSDRNSMGELLTALKDTSAHVRMRAAEALGEMGDGRALEPLLNAASDVSRHVRCAALASIGRLGIKSAMPSLVKAASDKSMEVRISAVKAVGALGEPGAYPVLIRCIRERQPALTRAAAEAMGYIPDVRCLDVLCSLLESTDQECVWRAAYSIYLLTKSGLIPIEGGRAATLIQKAMRSKDGHVLRACALALGVIGNQNAVGPLIALLRDPRDYVRSAAAVALGRIGDRRALRPLRLAMRDGRPTVRVKAAWALGELSCPEAVETLRLSLKDKVESVREMAAVSIFRLLERIALKS